MLNVVSILITAAINSTGPQSVGREVQGSEISDSKVRGVESGGVWVFNCLACGVDGKIIMLDFISRYFLTILLHVCGKELPERMRKHKSFEIGVSTTTRQPREAKNATQKCYTVEAA